METRDNSVKEVIKDGKLIAIIRKDLAGGPDGVFMCSPASSEEISELLVGGK